MVKLKRSFSPWFFSLGVITLSVVSFAIVTQSYDFTKDFARLKALEKDELNYEVKWGQLLLEQSALTQLSRLELAAINKLNMHSPSQDELIIAKP